MRGQRSGVLTTRRIELTFASWRARAITPFAATMKFSIAIEAGTRKSAFGVAVPDLPGCFSAGDTVEDAFDIEFPDHMFRKSTFHSVSAIRSAVVEVIGAQVS